MYVADPSSHKCDSATVQQHLSSGCAETTVSPAGVLQLAALVSIVTRMSGTIVVSIAVVVLRAVMAPSTVVPMISAASSQAQEHGQNQRQREKHNGLQLSHCMLHFSHD